ncbi:hypothetical protein C8R45DRAFT_945445 [Mycena sanguinolenta]|nr:hypothetical protein C8R45DRAFT_945445 [Mycena sanguinolenta]
MFKSTWGVTRDRFYLFDISAERPVERDMVENFGNASKPGCGWLSWELKKKEKETKSAKGIEALLSIFEASQANFRVFPNQWTNSTKACVTRDLDQSSGSTESIRYVTKYESAGYGTVLRTIWDPKYVAAFRVHTGHFPYTYSTYSRVVSGLPVRISYEEPDPPFGAKWYQLTDY